MSIDGLYFTTDNEAECTHVLAADFRDSTFALVMSSEELTLLTPDEPVTIDTKGRVYIGECNKPL